LKTPSMSSSSSSPLSTLLTPTHHSSKDYSQHPTRSKEISYHQPLPSTSSSLVPVSVDQGIVLGAQFISHTSHSTAQLPHSNQSQGSTSYTCFPSSQLPTHIRWSDAAEPLIPLTTQCQNCEAHEERLKKVLELLEKGKKKRAKQALRSMLFSRA
jgi:hypothetical protein